MNTVPKPVQLMNDVELIECLAFNIVPKNGFGSREHLTELKL